MKKNNKNTSNWQNLKHKHTYLSNYDQIINQSVTASNRHHN